MPLEQVLKYGAQVADALNKAHRAGGATAGHKRPGKDDTPKVIEETRQCIRDFDRLARTRTTARALYDKMLELYP